MPSFLSTRMRLTRPALSILLISTFVNGFLSTPSFTAFLRFRSQRSFATGVASNARVLLQVSTSPSQSIPSEKSANEPDESSNDFAMPWSKFQKWALRDNLPRYVVSIPVKRNGGSQQELYGLWRTMAREVTELSGYPIEMLQEMHARQLKRIDDEDMPLSVTPKVLPLLDEFEFEASGGLSGRVYGIAGVADGTKIETTAVRDVQFTVPKGYVQTEDGAVAYELGLPLRDFYSLDGTKGKAREITQAMTNAASGLGKGVVASEMTEEDPDTMIVRLGVSTAVLLAGATAMSILSHHLTVNVFWV